MHLTRLVVGWIFACAMMFAADSTVFCQNTMKDDKMMGERSMKDERPVVAIIFAEWCPACQSVDPIMKELMGEYGMKLNFVVFDVSNEEKIAASQKKAAKYGLADFFSDNKTKTSTVAVFKDGKQVYKTAKNSKKADYQKAFNSAVE